MMRLAILALAMAGAFVVVLTARHARVAKLRRLRQIVLPEAGKTSPPPEDGRRRTIEQFLPRVLVSHMRLLGIAPTLRDFVLTIALYALSIALAGRFGGVLPAAATAILLPVVGGAVLNILANRRIRELGALMPGFFDRVRQLLAIGNSLPTAFSRAVHAGQPSLVAFFAPALRRVANGAGFTESVRQSAEDVSLYEMHLFSAAVATNMRFGGSLTHSLNNLVLFLRKRTSIERELRASTAMIRSSAWVLGLLPILVAALIVSQNQEYARWFVTDPTGKWLLWYCVASQILGALVMRAIIRTEF
jgi:tight adherence protein B